MRQAIRTRRDEDRALAGEITPPLAVARLRTMPGATDLTPVDRLVAEDRARLAAIVDAAADAVIGTLPDGTITDWNPAAARMFGRSADEIVGRSVRMLYPLDADGTEFDHITSRIRAGDRWGPVLTRRRRADGTVIDVSLTVAPIRDTSGAVVAAAKIFRDVGQQLREQRLVERLVAAGEALSAERLDRQRIADVVLGEVVEAFSVPLAGVFLVEDGHLRTLAHHGARHALIETMERLPLDTPGWAAGDAVRRGVSVFLGSEEELESAYPAVADLPVRSGFHGALAFVPLRAGAEVLGLLGVRFDHDVTLTEAERGFLHGCAHQAALALERVTAFEAEQSARLEAQVAVERERLATLRAEFLSAASERLSRTFDREALRDVAELAVPRLADWCFVNLLAADGRRVNVAAAHRDPAEQGLAERSIQDRDATMPLLLDRTVFVDDLTDADLRSVAEDADHLEQLRAFDAQSYLAVPIRGRRGVLGSLAFLTVRGGRRLAQADVYLAEELARRIAPAIETARLHDDLRRIAALEMARAHEVEAVLHAVGEPIVVADRAGRVRIANQAALDAFGGDLPVSIDALRARFDDPDGMPDWRADGSAHPVEVRLRSTGRWYEVALYPVDGDETAAVERLDLVSAAWLDPTSDPDSLPGHGAPASTILVLRDVTELRRAQQLREAFIGVLSHELRTPITTIFGGSQVLVREGLEEGTRREVAADVVAEAERLHRLVEDLLVLARAERGAMDLGGDPVLIQHVIARVIRSEAARWPGVAVRAHVPPSLPAVTGDETYVEQIVRNLVGNAAKYGGVGAEVEVHAEDAGGEVHIRVLDDGPGFGAEDAERLFELFYRAPGTATKAGAGIGLFVCRALAEAMGGRIWALPRPAGGAEFGVALPVFGDEG